jgi:hypothetical protein
VRTGRRASKQWSEIAKAGKREVKEGNRVLFPVRLVGFERLRDWECFDGDTGKDSAREIREYFIPDFSNWKNHDSYQTAFQRLLTDLKLELCVARAPRLLYLLLASASQLPKPGNCRPRDMWATSPLDSGHDGESEGRGMRLVVEDRVRRCRPLR